MIYCYYSYINIVGHGGSLIESTPFVRRVNQSFSINQHSIKSINIRLIASISSWFKSRSSRHVGTLRKSFTRSCLWRL